MGRRGIFNLPSRRQEEGGGSQHPMASAVKTLEWVSTIENYVRKLYAILEKVYINFVIWHTLNKMKPISHPLKRYTVHLGLHSSIEIVATSVCIWR